MQRAGSRWRWGAAALLAAWLALGAGAEQTPRVPPQPASGEPRTVFSTSRRFTVTGFPAGTAVELARWADDVADRLAQATSPAPWPRGDYVEISASATEGEVTKAQGVADGRLQQRLWLGVGERLDQEDALEALVWLLLNRQVLYEQEPAAREADPASVPDWLAVGLAQNLYQELRQRNTRFGVDRWARGEQLALHEVAAREVMPPGRWMEKVDASLTVSWLLSRNPSWGACWTEQARGALSPVRWILLLSGMPSVREAEKLRDVWMAQQQDQRQALGEIDDRKLAEMRAWGVIPVDELRAAGATSREPLMLKDLVEQRKEAWARTVAERRALRVQLAGVGQAPEVQLVARCYAEFYEALARQGGRRPAAWLGRGGGGAKLNALLQQAEEAREALEASLRARSEYLAGWTAEGVRRDEAAEPDPAVRRYLDEVERELAP